MIKERLLSIRLVSDTSQVTNVRSHLFTYRRMDWARAVVAIRCSRTWPPCRPSAGPSGRCKSFVNPYPKCPRRRDGRWTAARHSLWSLYRRRTLEHKTPTEAYSNTNTDSVTIPVTILHTPTKRNWLVEFFICCFLSFGFFFCASGSISVLTHVK